MKTNYRSFRSFSDQKMVCAAKEVIKYCFQVVKKMFHLIKKKTSVFFKIGFYLRSVEDFPGGS